MLEDVCEENADAKGAAGDEEDFPSLAGETARWDWGAGEHLRNRWVHGEGCWTWSEEE